MSDKLKVLMLCDIDRGHQTRPSMPIYEKLFSDAGFDFRFSEDRNDLRREALQNVNVVVCYTTGGELTPEQGVDGIVNMVAAGVGFVGIHSAADSFHNCRRYERMVGGVFLNHPPIQKYMFTVRNHNHPVMAGVDDFVAPEELYLMETSGHFEVLLSTHWDGFERPAAWAKPYGFGRVFYTALGHSKEQHEGAMFQRMIVNAIRWTAARRGWKADPV